MNLPGTSGTSVGAPNYEALAQVSGVTVEDFRAYRERAASLDRRRFQRGLVRNAYTDRIKLYPKQKAFCMLPQMSAMAHGAGGTGKTELLLFLMLQYVHMPNYRCLVLRRTYKQLKMPNSILFRFHAKLRGMPYHWNGEDHIATFPSGAVIKFGHMENAANMFDYDSAEFHTIIIDEANQFSEEMLKFMFLRLRRTADDPIPLRYRLATNPGGISHLYLRNTYVENQGKDQDVFQMPFFMEDNPALDTVSYIKSLEKLDPVTYRRRRFGDWYVARQDVVIQHGWIKQIEAPFPGQKLYVRFWDLAATEPKKGKDPDYTVGTLISRDSIGRITIEDVQRFRLSPAMVEAKVRAVAELDKRNVYIRFEEEGGASGKSLVNYYTRQMPQYNVQGVRPGGPKLARWGPLAGQARAGNVFMVTGPWASEWLNEVTNVTGTDDPHDDQIDSAAGGYNTIVDEFLKGMPGVARL